MDRKLILDDKSFKALSADSRINILKKLNERRMTTSELGKKLNLKNSTIKEHCSILINAELISKIDEGRKWKYYELTGKGKQVVEPNLMQEAKVFVILSLTAIIFTGLFLFVMQNNIASSFGTLSDTSEMSVMQGQISSEDYIRTDSIEDQKFLTSMDFNIFSISIILFLLIGIFIGWTIGRRTI